MIRQRRKDIRVVTNSAIVESVLVRRFPLYREGERTGEYRQLQYVLVPGEAGWLLQLDRIVEY